MAKWLPTARCHFEKRHESFWEKGELLRCKWCEVMLKEFEIEGTVEGEEAYWGKQRGSGLRWKIKATDSPGHWDSNKQLKRGPQWV